MGLRDWLDRLLGRPVTTALEREVAGIRHGMDRRSFLRGALLGSVAAATLDVEQLLWVPKTQIVVPAMSYADAFDLAVEEGFTALMHQGPAGFRNPHTFITPEWITREALLLLDKELTFSRMLNRSYEVEGARIGTVLNIRKPAKFTARAGEAFDPQQIVCETEQVRLTDQYTVEMSHSRHESMMTQDQYRDRMLRPAVKSLAHGIKKAKMNVFAEPSLPEGLEYAAVHRGENLAVRGIQTVDHTTGEMRFRLDVVGGHSDVVEAEG